MDIWTLTENTQAAGETTCRTHFTVVTIRSKQIQGARSPWRLKMFTWRLNFHGFLSPYLQKNMPALEKKGLAPELFLVLSTPGHND
jgi:hypothetical protein